MIKKMTGDELKSMLKSNIHFKSLGGLKADDLKLTEAQLVPWRAMKLGLFIHWGLYSILGRGEWVRHNEKIPQEEYARLAERFNPRDFSVQTWVDAARSAGMRYMVLTARHHDGFALWDSPGSYGGFTSQNSAAGRDFVREYTTACRSAGLAVGLYYSPMDWRFPGYFKPKELLDNALLMKKQCHDQVEELVSRYGKIDILWYDGAWLAHSGSDPDGAWLWDPIALNRTVRRHNPLTAINPRSGLEGDFFCDEGSHPVKGEIVPVPWEKNMCLGSGVSWGYIPDDRVMTLPEVITMLVNVIVRDGNLLLNVGPDADGAIPAEMVERLGELGRFTSRYGESIFATRAGPLQPVDDVFGTTYRDRTVYLHILDTDRLAKLPLVFPSDVLSAEVLTGGRVTLARSEEGICFQVAAEPDAIDTIVRLQLAEPVPPLVFDRFDFQKPAPKAASVKEAL
ncbi:MAG: alpha-L-fucosidase [Eubacteriales bacterium]|nr:alpha-L-fucosidase [Eubacteriales bacterium]